MPRTKARPPSAFRSEVARLLDETRQVLIRSADRLRRADDGLDRADQANDLVREQIADVRQTLSLKR